jgi:hypothetical protein
MEPEPIRVLRVIARLNVGGPALHVSYLTRELDRIGYETTLVAGAIGESEGSMEWVAEDLGLEPVYLPALQREISPAHDLAAARQLLRLIQELRPDVLHTHGSPGRRGREPSSTRSTATSCAATSARRRQPRSCGSNAVSRGVPTRSSRSRRKFATTSSRSASRRGKRSP